MQTQLDLECAGLKHWGHLLQILVISFANSSFQMLAEPCLPGLAQSISVFLAEKGQTEPPLLERAPLGPHQADLQIQSLGCHFASLSASGSRHHWLIQLDEELRFKESYWDAPSAVFFSPPPTPVKKQKHGFLGDQESCVCTWSR